jgi:Major royal jelly protein
MRENVRTIGLLSGNQLVPYPKINPNENPRDAPSSVIGSTVDSCQRIWILDSGIFGVCPPQIIINDLNNNKFVQRFVFFSPIVSIFI